MALLGLYACCHSEEYPIRYKPDAIAKWLPKLNYLVYLDMDLVVKDASVDFARRYVGQV